MTTVYFIFLLIRRKAQQYNLKNSVSIRRKNRELISNKFDKPELEDYSIIDEIFQSLQDQDSISQAICLLYQLISEYYFQIPIEIIQAVLYLFELEQMTNEIIDVLAFISISPENYSFDIDFFPISELTKYFMINPHAIDIITNIFDASESVCIQVLDSGIIDQLNNCFKDVNDITLLNSLLHFLANLARYHNISFHLLPTFANISDSLSNYQEEEQFVSLWAIFNFLEGSSQFQTCMNDLHILKNLPHWIFLENSGQITGPLIRIVYIISREEKDISAYFISNLIIDFIFGKISVCDEETAIFIYKTLYNFLIMPDTSEYPHKIIFFEDNQKLDLIMYKLNSMSIEGLFHAVYLIMKIAEEVTIEFQDYMINNGLLDIISQNISLFDDDLLYKVYNSILHIISKAKDSMRNDIIWAIISNDDITMGFEQTNSFQKYGRFIEEMKILCLEDNQL